MARSFAMLKAASKTSGKCSNGERLSASNISLLDEIRSQHRLLAILRALLRAPAYRLNAEVLGTWLEKLALSAAGAVYEADFQRLKELGFCSLEREADMISVTLTRAGADVAKGLVQVAEIARPGPECPY